LKDELMRLKKIKLKNFRCYKDETEIDIDNLTVFIGKNDAGKSSIFDALNIFFNEPKGQPDKDDYNITASETDIEITCIFDELPSQIVIDANYPTTLLNEYILNSQGFLEIKKVYPSSGKSRIVAVASHPSDDGYSDLLTLTNAKLKQRASSLNVDLTDVDQRINSALRNSIWKHKDNLNLTMQYIDLSKDTAKEIWEKIKPQLPVFALFKSDRTSTDQDDEAQDPMKAAIKEAISAQEQTLNAIAEQVTNEIQTIANKTVEKIQEMNPELARQLNPRVSIKKWDSLFSVSLTGDENIPINKRGSGTRRLILLNFFRAKAEQDSNDKNTGIIYAIEEPETSQHPNNQKMLIDAFESLVENNSCQILLTTHTPVLARRFAQDSLRLIAESNGNIEVLCGTDEEAIKKIIHTLGVLPDHDVKVFMGVEGKYDIDFFIAISKILKEAGETVPDLGEAEKQGKLVFVPLGGSNIELWISRLEGFKRPEFYVMDRDTEPPTPAHYESIANSLNARNDCIAWTTSKKELENYIHKDLIVAVYPNYIGKGIAYEDVPSLFAQAVHEASGSEVAWADLDKDLISKKISKAKKRLNSELFISKMTPELLSEVDSNGDIRDLLRKIGNALDN